VNENFQGELVFTDNWRLDCLNAIICEEIFAMSENDEIIIPGRHGSENRAVTPIDRMTFRDLNQRRLSGDFESDRHLRDRADDRMRRLVALAEDQGVLPVVDRAVQNVLRQSRNFGEAANNLDSSRRDILEDLKDVGYSRDSEIYGLPEAEINLLVDGFRIAGEAVELGARGASLDERRAHNERLEALRTRQIRPLDYQLEDYLGRGLSPEERNRPQFNYRSVSRNLQNAAFGSVEYNNALDQRRELLAYYHQMGIDPNNVGKRIDEVLKDETVNSGEVINRLRGLQRDVENDARARGVYREGDYGLFGDAVGGVIEVGQAFLNTNPADNDAVEELNRLVDRALPIRVDIGDIENAFKEKEKYPKTQAEWVLMVHRKLLEAEREAVKDLQKSNEKPKLWDEMENDIKEAKIKFADNRGTRHEFLSRQFSDTYPEGVHFPELLELYVSARSDLIDRYIEVHPDRSKGSLTLLGRVEDMPFEGIRIRLQELSGMTSWINIHNDEIFRDIVEGAPEDLIPLKEKKEILADVDAGMSEWWDVGIKGYKNRDFLYNPNYAPNTPANQRREKVNYDRKGLFQDIVDDELAEAGLENLTVEQLREAASLLGSRFRVPTYFDSMLSASDMSRLRSLVSKKLDMGDKGGTRASQIAWMIHSVNFSVDLWDKDRESISLAGKADVRDMIHYERKRVQDFAEKGRQPAGDEVTMGFYFALPDQEAFSDEKLRRVYYLDEVVQERVDRLRLNWERAVFRLRKNAYDYGEFASDVWHSVTVPVRDELTGKTIRKKLSSFAVAPTGDAIPGGWKKMPLERMALREYSGYIEYGASIQGMISKEISGGNYKPEQMQEPRHWQIEASKFRRLTSLSPWFNDLEMQTRGAFLREVLEKQGGFDQKKVNRIYGYASREDLHMFTEDEQNRIEDIINNGRVGNGRNDISVKDRLTVQAKATADDGIRDKIGHILLGFCLGEVWPGSLDAKGLEARVVGEMSPITHPQFVKIERAIKMSGILPAEYQHDFRLIANREFGFGTPEGMALTGGKRYIRASELYCADKER